MKLSLILLPACTLAAIALLSSAQDSKKPAAAGGRDDTHHMDAGPGPANQKLVAHAGKYVANTKFDMGNGAPPMESTGEATFESVLGGRFLVQRETNTMVGMPFESLKMYGYNADSGRYEGTWTYSGSTAIMSLNGTSTDGGKTIVFSASYEGAARKRTEYEITFREIDADHFSTKLVDKAPDHASSFETMYTRAK
jgi:hypothetical protein